MSAAFLIAVNVLCAAGLILTGQPLLALIPVACGAFIAGAELSERIIKAK